MSAVVHGRLSATSKRILDAARGTGRRRVLKCFPLAGTSSHVGPALPTPSDFHKALCDAIYNAKNRVLLCSLYIGPAVGENATKERELLHAIASSPAKHVSILMDQNRAMRPVPVPGETTTTISSAQACARAIQNDHRGNIYLLSVLPAWQQRLLPNPYNEACGVFHLKCYICDDTLILSGANLSEEYFTNRIDRYLWLQNSELVECYADMVQALCQHAELYKENDETSSGSRQRTTRQELLESLTDILTQEAHESEATVGSRLKMISSDVPNTVSEISGNDDNSSDPASDYEKHIDAYAVPTFQAPPGFFSGLDNPIPADVDLVNDLVTAVATSAAKTSESAHVRLASAYLNPTDSMISSMAQCCHHSKTAIHLLTAGRISHGFKPNPKTSGNKGKAWIPAVFDALGRRAVRVLQEKRNSTSNSNSNINLWYYQRPDWTFHAKGMWLTTNNNNNSNNAAGINSSSSSSSSSNNSSFSSSGSNSDDDIRISDASTLCAVTHGSGNYGGRSTYCDMESNLILVLPSGQSNFKSMLQKDWNDMCDYAASADKEEKQALSSRLRLLLPAIRPFF